MITSVVMFLLSPHADGTQIRAKNSLGTQRVLVLAVKFPNIQPEKSLGKIKEDVLEGCAKYFYAQSYGKTLLTGEIKGWYSLPRRMEEYKVYLDDWGEDKKRGRLLVEDALNASEKEVAFKEYDHIVIALGVPGKDFGMMGYTANPGVLSGVRHGKARMVRVTTTGGQKFRGGITLTTEDAHLGQRAVDLAVILGGVIDGTRVIPMLYDIQRNIGTSRGQHKATGGRSRESWERDALRIEMRQQWQTFMGPWDLLSCHFVQFDLPPPGMSCFSRLRLEWIEDEQVVQVLPGESKAITLQPLGNGKGTLVIKIPGLSNTYYLLENRQKVSGDPIMPSTGLVVLHMDESKEDGEGIVRIVDSNHKVPYFGAAPFGVKKGQVPSLSLPQDIAVEVLWQQDLDMTVMVTNRSKAPKVQEVAQLIRECQKKLEGRSDTPVHTKAKEDLSGAMELLMKMEIDDSRTKVEHLLKEMK